jgi:hypothetical protein
MRDTGSFKLALILPIVIIFVIAAIEFTPELYAFGWHTLHRGTARFKGANQTAYELRVPASFSAYRSDECSISVSKQAGPIRSLLGQRAKSQMTFSACQIYTTVKEIEANAPKLKDELGIMMVHRGTISVAGQELHCYERSGDSGTQGNGSAIVDCVPRTTDEELSASFVGSDDHLPAFYSLLKTVKPADAD